jgi:hypothetical protein
MQGATSLIRSKPDASYEVETAAAAISEPVGVSKIKSSCARVKYSK